MKEKGGGKEKSVEEISRNEKKNDWKKKKEREEERKEEIICPSWESNTLRDSIRSNKFVLRVTFICPRNS